MCERTQTRRLPAATLSDNRACGVIDLGIQVTIPHQLADQNHALFSRKDDAGRRGARPVAIETQDHGVIRAWAESHGLAPAALFTCRDTEKRGGSGQLRLTCAVASTAAPATWADWLSRFDALGLSFVFEATMSRLRLATPLTARGSVASDRSSSPRPVEAASTGRFRIKRARVGF